MSRNRCSRSPDWALRVTGQFVEHWHKAAWAWARLATQMTPELTSLLNDGGHRIPKHAVGILARLSKLRLWNFEELQRWAPPEALCKHLSASLKKRRNWK